jgi:hypothetical protein
MVGQRCASLRVLNFSLNLPGDFNIRNALTALAMVEAIGGDLERATVGLGQAHVAGRMQRVELGPDAPRVYVDFNDLDQRGYFQVRAIDADRPLRLSEPVSLHDGEERGCGSIHRR